MMVNDRLVLKIKTYDDDDEYRNRVIKIKEEGTIRLEIHGKDGSGTKKMAIEVRYNRLANAIRFHIEVPEEWEGHLNEYLITSMVLQKLNNKVGRP